MINSGDILVMCNEARLCYHAVPKILHASTMPWDYDDTSELNGTLLPDNFKYISNVQRIYNEMSSIKDDFIWNRFRGYINEARININVRQVLHEGQTSL